MKGKLYRNKWRQIISAVLALVIIFPLSLLIFPKKTNAQFLVVPTFEVNPAIVVPTFITAASSMVSAAANTVTAVNTTLESPVKEFALDTIAWLIVNMVIERIAASTVNWINSGFKGSPAFITNPEAYFKRIADQTAGQIIFNHPDLRFMCSSLRAKVQIALTQNYIQPYNYQCTLSDAGRNFDNFMNDFNQGGWDNFIEVSQRSQNNPLGLYNQLNNQMNVQIGSSLGQKQEELNWGNGFLSWKSCAQWSEPGTAYTSPARTGYTGVPLDDGSGQYTDEYAEIPEKTTEGTPPVCIKPVVNTPGSVISEQLNSVLHIGNDRLQVADEINEIISALLNQLVGRIVGGIGKGLRALSSPGSGSNGEIYANQLQNATTQDRVPMPANGRCPAGYAALSYDECGSNTLIRRLADEAIAAQAAAQAAINAAQQAGQGLPPPSTPFSPTLPPPTPTPPATCPAPPTLVLTPGIIAVGGTSFVSLPTAGWTIGITTSDDNDIARATGLTVTGISPGSTFINAYNVTAPNGASPCTVFGSTITVN